MEAPSLLCFNLQLTFFGYKPIDRPKLHAILFDFIWESNGKFSWDDVYNIPLNIRRLWIKKLNMHTEARNKQLTSDKTTKTPVSKIAKPPV